MANKGECISFDSVLIVEDDPSTQRRFAQLLLEFTISSDCITIAESVAEAKASVFAHKPRFALIDIGLPDGSGLELIQWVTQQYPETVSVAVSAWGHEEVVLAALRLGAAGYLMKERDNSELRVALQSVRRGGALIDPFIAKRILDFVSLVPMGNVAGPAVHAEISATLPNKSGALLSEREAEILKLVARGYSNREIAELTSLSRFTIEDYTKSIYRKLAVSSRTAAVFEAQSMGILR